MKKKIVGSEADGGFTLIEILIAIFIFAVLITTVFGSYRSVFSNTGTMDRNMDLYETGQNCLQRIIGDLESMHLSVPPTYSPPGFNEPQEPYRFVGVVDMLGSSTFSRLRFASLSHLPFFPDLRQGISEIVYYVRPSKDGHFKLKRSDNIYPFIYKYTKKKRIDPVLCEEIMKFDLKFYSHDGTEHDEWHSESKAFNYETPKAVKIQIDLTNDLTSQSFETVVILPVNRRENE
ncbi:MAG: type II secretion system protein J [Desulfobacterales bacterium]